MAYGTVPCLGVTFHDLQSWFGVDVHWNGLVYADALYRLAAAGPQNPAVWSKLADGIVASAIQQQALSGPWLGMYPDAFSPVTGDEEYTWWLNPNLIGLNTFELAGIPLDLTTTTVQNGHADPIRITSGATVRSATANGSGLTLVLDYPPGESSQTLIAGLDKPATVTVEAGETAPVDNLDAGPSGWQSLTDPALLAIKAAHGNQGTVTVRITTETAP
jgi:hypothetical protein